MKKSIEEVKEWLLENRVDENGDLDLRGLDFSDFKGNIDISHMKVKESLWQNRQEVGKDLLQGYQIISGNLFQDQQKVDCYLWQDEQTVGGNLYQDGQEVHGKFISD